MPRDPQALEAILRVAIVPGIGPARLSALLARFGGVEQVLRASAREVSEIPGFGPELARRVASAGTDEGLQRARTAYRALRQAGAVVVTAQDDVYPAAFRTLPDPPLVLYALGDVHLLGDPGIGVVGTRLPTDYGRRTAAGLARELARAGYSIVSGMAKGIDAVAQAAALDAGGATVGVLGHGIDRVYPTENELLFARVRERGLLITELPPGEEPLAGNFPRRNRLIAALSAGVLVVEMGERSGAKHTVDYALELGKEVFAVPGPIGSPASAGTNQLLKDGARLVTSARDVLEELHGVGLTPRAGFVPAPSADVVAPPPRPVVPPDLAPDEARVFAGLSDTPRHVDDLAAALGMPTSAALTALLGLELRELVEALPGKQFRLR
ncbi:DNA-processing protein DprA [Longimicrobium sp.]|uniref:DNA-processing protein DprA n=1 Tax=Longimicrobium sp. TaxID=2029185 RepID=UPI002E36248C|nr:DNA-processing protein DprA [Longimicrobium sp.]HEX6041876.1 DNA-processing protein DprA [Longimicrobium sp.]